MKENNPEIIINGKIPYAFKKFTNSLNNREKEMKSQEKKVGSLN